MPSSKALRQTPKSVCLPDSVAWTSTTRFLQCSTKKAGDAVAEIERLLSHNNPDPRKLMLAGVLLDEVELQLVAVRRRLNSACVNSQLEGA